MTLPDMEKTKTIEVEALSQAFDIEFRTKETDTDPAMSRFVPMVYDPINFDWKSFFEPEFCQRFNGLMINGQKPIQKVVCVTFLNDEVVTKILQEHEEGIMIFAHHPIQMECGDPRGEKGKGFLPVNPELLKQMKDKGVSVYTCHAPLDAGSKSGLGTGEALVKRLGATVLSQYDPYGHGFAARVCELPNETTTDQLAEQLRALFNLPYVDIQGVKNRTIKKIVILPGGGGSCDDIKGAEEQGVDCIVTGEVTAKIDNERGQREQKALDEYYPNAKISAIGLSHAGSEFLVMLDVAEWIKTNLSLKAETLPENKWWR